MGNRLWDSSKVNKDRLWAIGNGQFKKQRIADNGLEDLGKDGFKDLRVWQRSKDLAVAIYKTTEEGSLARDFGLRNQMRRASR